jgi:hypothetical protein
MIPWTTSFILILRRSHGGFGAEGCDRIIQGAMAQGTHGVTMANIIFKGEINP